MPGDRVVCLLDQRLLPRAEHYELLSRWEQVAEAIQTLAVRGAPAIGIAAAYGLVLGAGALAEKDAAAFVAGFREIGETLRKTRPTAVNLAWAAQRMETAAAAIAGQPGAARTLALAKEARAIHAEDVAACRRMGQLGADLLPSGVNVLTHCNAGALATGGYGSALGVVRALRSAHKLGRVFATETRPLLQGARLTAWELMRDGVNVTLVADSVAATLMQRGEVSAVVVGADRLARNGDVANKIGTYSLACLAAAHNLPLVVAAPWSTVDLEAATGDAIPIEMRTSDEVTHVRVGDDSVHSAPDGVRTFNPAFDVTPARLVHAIVTERGVVRPSKGETLDSLKP
jgi:methylthioribose-1-phosphate isomerase